MADDFGFIAVTVDDGMGSGPVKAVRDSGGRIFTLEQMQEICQRQEEELAATTTQRDQLVAGDTALTTQLVGEYTQGLTRELAMLDQHRADTSATLEKLTAGDVATTSEVIEKLKDQFNYRVEMVTTARDRTVQVLALMAPDAPTTTSTQTTPTT